MIELTKSIIHVSSLHIIPETMLGELLLTHKHPLRSLEVSQSADKDHYLLVQDRLTISSKLCLVCEHFLTRS